MEEREAIVAVEKAVEKVVEEMEVMALVDTEEEEEAKRLGEDDAATVEEERKEDGNGEANAGGRARVRN